MGNTKQIEVSAELQDAMAGFVPRFGNDDDISIVKRWGDLQHKLVLLDESEARRAELRKLTKDKPKSIQAIEQLEQNLIYALKNRGVIPKQAEKTQ